MSERAGLGRSSRDGNSPSPWPLLIAGVVLVVGLVTAVVFILTHASNTPSEATQAARDRANGAALPETGGRDCPNGFPVKAKYFVDQKARYFFTPGDDSYDATRPTSCWATIDVARKSGYAAPPSG